MSTLAAFDGRKYAGAKEAFIEDLQSEFAERDERSGAVSTVNLWNYRDRDEHFSARGYVRLLREWHTIFSA